jgi:hypothetical protein
MKTIHGWDVIPKGDDPRLKLFTIPGTDRKIRLRKDVGPYLVAFAAEYHQKIAPIDKGTFDDWGWCPLRDGRASSFPSDHCGGVALDLNATKEGAQNRSNVSWWKNPVRAAKFSALRKKFHLLEWGGSYTKAYDPMHHTFNFGVGSASVLVEMKKLGIMPSGKIRQP